MRNIFVTTILLFTLSIMLNAQNFRVLTYNIRYDNPNDSINSWENRKVKFVEQLKNFDCDVIGIQEGLESQIDFLKKQLSSYQFYGVGRDDGYKKGEFAGIFFKKSRFELIDSGTFWLSPTPSKPSKGWDAALNRICSFVKLHDILSSKDIWVFNTHYDHIGSQARFESSKLILNKIGELTKNDKNVIICGDFNSTRTDRAILEISKKFQDSYELSKNHLGNQISSFNGFGSKDAVQQQIDFIFYNSKTLVSVVFLIGNEKISDTQYYSDHYPVLCEFGYLN